MRPERDVVLSVQRLLAAVLPDGEEGSPDRWTVMRTNEPSSPPERPFVLVEEIAASTTVMVGVSQDVTVPITATLYFQAAESRRQALDRFSEVRSLIWQAVKWGVEPDRLTPDRIQRWRHDPVDERHRFVVHAAAGTWSVVIDSDEFGEVVAAGLPVGAEADDVAAAVADALRDAGAPDDVVVEGVDRGVGFVELVYGGALAGGPVGVPQVNEDALTDVVKVEAAVATQGFASPWRRRNDYLRVAGFQISQPLLDPTDPTLLTMAVDMRCTLAVGARVPSGQTLLQRLEAR